MFKGVYQDASGIFVALSDSLHVEQGLKQSGGSNERVNIADALALLKESILLAYLGQEGKQREG